MSGHVRVRASPSCAIRTYALRPKKKVESSIDLFGSRGHEQCASIMQLTFCATTAAGAGGDAVIDGQSSEEEDEGDTYAIDSASADLSM